MNDTPPNHYLKAMVRQRGSFSAHSPVVLADHNINNSGIDYETDFNSK